MLVSGRHFSPAEFACHSGVPYPEDWGDRWELLVGLCDKIRDLWGGPLVVVSGYRTPDYNADLIMMDAGKGAHGVASSSQHIQGNAADLATTRHAFDVAQLYRVILTAYEDKKLPELGGLGLYPISGWCHVDTFKAPDGHLRKWTGT